jgi:hypothetical protein
VGEQPENIRAVLTLMANSAHPPEWNPNSQTSHFVTPAPRADSCVITQAADLFLPTLSITCTPPHPVIHTPDFYTEIRRREMQQTDPNLLDDLSPVQEKVLAAIVAGATMQAAAKSAGIHRNAIAYWRHTSPLFGYALRQAHYDKAIFIREQAENHVADAFAAIHEILTSPDASDSVRLNAAKYIIEKASTPPPPNDVLTCKPDNAPEEIVHNDAQIGSVPQNPEAPQEPSAPKIVHSNAQSRPVPTVRSARKVGRNEPCPCGSGQKFKRCCIGKTNLAAAAA